MPLHTPPEQVPLYNQKIKTCFTRRKKNKRCDDLAGLVHDVIQSGLKLNRGWLCRFINVIADLMAFLNEGTFVMSQASNRRESFFGMSFSPQE